MKLTARQTEILNLIRDAIIEHGAPPTRAEICQQLGFKSPNAAEEHLRALARKGAIEMVPGTSRGIRLLGESGLLNKSARGLPLIGRVAAGSPLLAEENIENHYQLDASMFHPRADYLLRVQGESMRGIGILDNDLLAVHRTTEVSNGQIVVARIEDEVTVKRFHRKEAHSKSIQLLPENPDFDPIEVDLQSSSFAIEGLAVGVLRNGGLQ